MEIPHDHREPLPSAGGDDAEAQVPLAARAVRPLIYEKPAGGMGLDPYVLEGSARRHVFLPLALVCVGTAMLYGGSAWRVGAGNEFVQLGLRQGRDVAFSLIASLAAAYWCARALDATFGLLTPAVAKLAAVVVLPAGAASLIAAALGGGGGAVALGLLFSVPVMWFAFLGLFNKMDGREAVICCNVFTLVRLVSVLLFRPF